MTGDRLTSRIIAGLLIFLGGCATQPAAPENSAERAASAAYFADDFSCTRTTSEDIDLKLLNAATARYMEKCIRLEAFTDGSALYVNAKGMTPIRDSSAGLYWRDESIPKHLKLGPSFVIITGRLRDCAKHNAMTAQAPETAPGDVPAKAAILGACKTSATAIFVSDAQIIPTAMD